MFCIRVGIESNGSQIAVSGKFIYTNLTVHSQAGSLRLRICFDGVDHNGVEFMDNKQIDSLTWRRRIRRRRIYFSHKNQT